MTELGELLWSDQQMLARSWLERAAGLGSWIAADTLANLTSMAEESERWRHVRVALAQQGVESGDVYAMTYLAWLLKDTDPIRSDALHRRAAQTGNADAMRRFGTVLEGRGQESEAIHWYRQAAEAGQVSAMRELGWLLLFYGCAQ